MVLLKKELYNKKNELILKLTVEERRDGMYIATLWNPDCCLEVDRNVVVYETYSAAESYANYVLIEFLLVNSDYNLTESYE